MNGPQAVHFDASQYDAEVQRALGDLSWESPERTASRKIMQQADLASLESRGFQLQWASGGCKAGTMTISLSMRPGPYQVLVELPWNGEEIEGIVRQAIALLRQNEQTWPIVACHPQVQGLAAAPLPIKLKID